MAGGGGGGGAHGPGALADPGGGAGTPGALSAQLAQPAALQGLQDRAVGEAVKQAGDLVGDHVIDLHRPAPAAAGGGGDLVVAVSYSGAAVASLPTGLVSVLAFDTTDYDPFGYHDAAAAPTRFTVPAGRAGWHRFAAYFRVARTSSASPAPNYLAALRVNGSPDYLGRHSDVFLAAYGLDVRYAWTLYYALEEGDSVELIFTHNTGATEFLQAGTWRTPRFQIERRAAD